MTNIIRLTILFLQIVLIALLIALLRPIAFKLTFFGARIISSEAKEMRSGKRRYYNLGIANNTKEEVVIHYKQSCSSSGEGITMIERP